MKNKNINNCTDIKFIYPSNRSALSYMKKTTKSSDFMNDASKKSEDVIYKDYGEVYMLKSGWVNVDVFCDILVVSCLCDCLCVKSESMQTQYCQKKNIGNVEDKCLDRSNTTSGRAAPMNYCAWFELCLLGTVIFIPSPSVHFLWSNCNTCLSVFPIGSCQCNYKQCMELYFYIMTDVNIY